MKLDTLQRVELSEGVEIRLRMAGPLIRGFAWLVDCAILAGVYFVTVMVLVIMGIFTDLNIAGGLMLLMLFLVQWFYYVYFEASRRGATPGKRSMGLRVTRPSGAPISISQSIIRNFLRVVDGLPYSPVPYLLIGESLPFPSYLLGLAACLFTRKFQRLGDLAANTVVIYVKQEAHTRNRNRPPVALRAQEDIQPVAPQWPLSREEQSAIITYADRAPMWSEERKIELADHLEPLTGVTGKRGVAKLLGIGRWIQNS